MVRNYERKTVDRWSKDDLLEALVRIKDSNLKINDAAQEYGISRATLYRQYQKFMLGGGRLDAEQFRGVGGSRILAKVDEAVLAKTIKDLRGQGYTITTANIRRICFEYCEANGLPNKFDRGKRLASEDWYHGFVKRHPEVKLPKDGEGEAVMMTLSGAEGNSSASIEEGGAVPVTAGTLVAAIVNVKPPKKRVANAGSSPNKKLKLESPVSEFSEAPLVEVVLVGTEEMVAFQFEEGEYLEEDQEGQGQGQEEQW